MASNPQPDVQNPSDFAHRVYIWKKGVAVYWKSNEEAILTKKENYGVAYFITVTQSAY